MMAGSAPDLAMRDGVIFSEKSVVDERVIDSPPSESEQIIVNDWDGEEAAVKRKWVLTESNHPSLR